MPGFNLNAHSFVGFAICVDVNHFTKLVSTWTDGTIAQMTRDILTGSIAGIENEGGEVFGLAGDAIVGVLPDADATYVACCRIAKDLNAQCEYISNAQTNPPHVWPELPGGPGLKIGVEYGTMYTSTIHTRFLGTQPLIVGHAINVAFRITNALWGNRCIVGPQAMKMGLDNYPYSGPMSIAGKEGEPNFEFFHLDMSDVWIEGDRDKKGNGYW